MTAGFPGFGAALLLAGTLAGLAVGWIMRSRRAGDAERQESLRFESELDANRNEHRRLSEQNRGLMQQVSEYQASSRDAAHRARELSEALREAFARRDQLKKDVKAVRGNLERVVDERNRLEIDVRSLDSRVGDAGTALRQKDAEIFRLSRELRSWQERLPPLLERFHQRDAEVVRLTAELADARQRIDALETELGSGGTRIEPVDSGALGTAMAASNDPNDGGGERHPANRGDAAADEPPSAGQYGQHNGRSSAVLMLAVTDEVTTTASADREPARGLRDDLKRIKGVGPAIEKTLNELGIFRFSQVAAMSDFDIERIARRLRGFRTRIEREDWIGQARALDGRKEAEGTGSV